MPARCVKALGHEVDGVSAHELVLIGVVLCSVPGAEELHAFGGDGET